MLRIATVQVLMLMEFCFPPERSWRTGRMRFQFLVFDNVLSELDIPSHSPWPPALL